MTNVNSDAIRLAIESKFDTLLKLTGKVPALSFLDLPESEKVMALRTNLKSKDGKFTLPRLG
jgi:hypothetical protein